MFVDIRSTFKWKCQPKLCPGQFSIDEDGDLVVRRNPLAKGIIIGKILCKQICSKRANIYEKFHNRFVCGIRTYESEFVKYGRHASVAERVIDERFYHRKQAYFHWRTSRFGTRFRGRINWNRGRHVLQRDHIHR